MYGKIECASLLGRRLHPDASAMPFYYFLANGKPDAGTAVIRLIVQPLEDDENLVEELSIDADAIIGHGEQPVGGFFPGSNADDRGAVRMIFKSIAKQILKQLGQLNLVAGDHGEH